MPGHWATSKSANARRRPSARRLWTLTTALALALGTLVALPVTPVEAAPTSTLALEVVSARTDDKALGGAGVTKGDAVTEFKYIINEDNTGTTEQRSPSNGCAATDPGYPGSCNWPSITEIPKMSPIYTQGDQGDFSGAGLENLPDGRYLISVLADGYKIDGEHFAMPRDTADGPLRVELQPGPLPDSTLRAQVFADVAPTNGTLDVGDVPKAGFVGHVSDTLGEVQTDVYGNPLCTTYQGEDPDTHVIPEGSLDGDELPIVLKKGGECQSDADGILTIPHLGSNRYTTTVTPPDGQEWIQTTTLEGNHDWDTWLMEGATGWDTEFVLAGEQVPQPIFGFAPPTKNGQPLSSGASGRIKGSVVGINTYTPPKGGSFDFWGGNTGTKVKHPIDRPWLSLADLEDGDQAVWVGQGNDKGQFDITGVPDGNYQLSWWDEPQDYNLNFINVTVSNGELVEMGRLPLNGWWTEYDGYVFEDSNRNGVKDPGEQGVPNFTLTLRKRDNSLMDRGSNTVTTDANGYYNFESAYPLGEWTVMEAYSDSFFTTGVTYQADNQPEPTTVKGAGVDVSVLNIIGLGGRMDWGVHAYDPSGTTNGLDPRNGGIVGSVSYDTTRNELDPQFAASEDWQPGIADIPVELYATVPCGTNAGTPCDADERYELADDGSYARGKLLNTYLSEHFDRPAGCTARDVNGDPLVHGTDENVLVPSQEDDGECISSFIQGVQFGPYATDQGTPDANFGATVDGNYGFGDGCVGGTIQDSAGRTPADADFDYSDPVCTGGSFEALGVDDYLVHIAIPDDSRGRPLYKVTGEEDINIGNGDQIIPQVPPPPCAGALHTVDVAGIAPDGPNAVENPTFVDIEGSPYEGMEKPLCDTKLVRVNNGKSIVPMFNVFTDVPIPSRLRGLVVDDVNFSTDPRSVMFGEKAGVPFAPVGIYDFNNRLVTTVESDFNGIYDVLMPSTNHISCPTPSGVCANMYRFVANDPGIPGRLNPNYNPRYRTIATEFESMPGVTIPTDLAPTQVGLTVESPATGQAQVVTCPLDGATPQLLAVNRPYVKSGGDRTFTIKGTGFGAGPGEVTLDGTALPTSGWSATEITASVPANFPTGAHQLGITAAGANAQSAVNALTFHVLGAGYNPNLYEVGPDVSVARYNPTNAASKSALGVDHAIQNALNDARTSSGNDLVVVYPGTPDLDNPRNNPRGAYYENLVMASPVKLQGVGPGGFQGNTFVPGSIIDAEAFGGDTDLATDWYDLVGSLTWDGNQAVNDGEGIYVIASQNATSANGRAHQFTSGFKAGIDGFDLRGGNQRGFPGNINDLTGAPTGLPPGIVTQGGAVFANAYARYLQITNNVVQNNGAGYGTIRIGTPDLPAPDTNQHNENVRIANNRVISNAGTNLAGGIGIFGGSDGYEVAGNDICGNFSMEYGGGLSVYGRSPNGKIHNNRIYFNMSNDEGGGIMVAGALQANPDALSPGSGPVDIYANQIQANLANDDGGGIRFLMAGGSGGTDAMNVYNNMIVNNVSTHEGGGIGINDAPNVRVFNNTIMKNLTTATAVTSNGMPMPAGVSTSANSDQLQATLPGGVANCGVGSNAPCFSNPRLFNNILWDNRAGSRAGTSVTGVGLGGPTDIDNWDVGVGDGTGLLAPTNSIVQQSAADHPFTNPAGANNSAQDPQVVEPYDVSVSFATWRQNPAFVDATLVALEEPPNLLGDYHLSDCPSPACNLGAASSGGINAPTTDFDGQLRPALGGYDSGADEFGAMAPPPPPPPSSASELYFSTAGNTNPTNVGGTADDADVYHWNGSQFNRHWDASVAGLAPGANMDGLSRVDDTRFYASFDGAVSLPGAGTVQDEDVVYYNGSTWQMILDGSTHGFLALTNLDAISVDGSTLYFSTSNGIAPPGTGNLLSGDDSDIYRWNGGDSFTRVRNGSSLPSGNVDGLVWTDASHLSVSYSGNTSVPGLGAVQDEDVVSYDGNQWSTSFDGTDQGMTNDNQDLDAISFDTGASPPATAPTIAQLSLSLAGNAKPPGVPGVADNADLFHGDGTAPFTRAFNATRSGLPRSANVDGYDAIDANHFYVSFGNATTRVRGLGKVQDEDVLYYNNGKWRMFFNGTAHGLRKPSQDIDAVSVIGKTLYFSTRGNAKVPGVRGTPDNADVYSWNKRSYRRVWDATRFGLGRAVDVDGLDRVPGAGYYFSFSNTRTAAPGLSTVQDEDIVQYDDDRWTLVFDGSRKGLTRASQDVDAFSVNATRDPIALRKVAP